MEKLRDSPNDLQKRICLINPASKICKIARSKRTTAETNLIKTIYNQKCRLNKQTILKNSKNKVTQKKPEEHLGLQKWYDFGILLAVLWSKKSDHVDYKQAWSGALSLKAHLICCKSKPSDWDLHRLRPGRSQQGNPMGYVVTCREVDAKTVTGNLVELSPEPKGHAMTWQGTRLVEWCKLRGCSRITTLIEK